VTGRWVTGRRVTGGDEGGHLGGRHPPSPFQRGPARVLAEPVTVGAHPEDVIRPDA
jgi:hypothetical protein